MTHKQRMACFTCEDGTYKKVKIKWEHTTKWGLKVVIRNLIVLRCNKCGPDEEVMPPEAWNRIDKAMLKAWAQCPGFKPRTDPFLSTKRCDQCGRTKDEHTNHGQ